MPIGHTQMAMDVVWPGLKALGGGPAAYSSKVSWTQANGYFITSGLLFLHMSITYICYHEIADSSAALLCFKWGQDGLRASLDRYIFAVLMATHLAAGGAYFKKGIFPPALVYWTNSLLMGIAAAKGR